MCVHVRVCARTPPLVQRICYRFLFVARHDLDDFTTVTAFEKHREFMVGTRVPRLHLDSPTPPSIRDQVVSASFNRRALGGLAALRLEQVALRAAPRYQSRPYRSRDPALYLCV